MENIKVHPLRAWRAGQGLSQTKLAEMIGYSTPGLIHSIETGKYIPKITEVLKFCELSEGTLKPEDFKAIQ